MQTFILYSLSWEQADVKTREAFSFAKEDIVTLNEQLKPLDQLSEWMVLSTCNRTEILTRAAISSVTEVVTLIADIKNQPISFTQKVFTIHTNDALPYFASVTAGIRSQILGDAQILHQVKSAYRFACECQTVGPYTHRLMQLLFASNKKITTQTNFKTGISSVPYAAIDMAKEYMEMYSEPAIAVVGFGEMGQSICKYLISKGVKHITVFNRSKEKVRDFFRSRPIAYSFLELDQLSEKLVTYDIVFSAIDAQNFIISAEMVCHDRKGFFQLLIDLSLPRSIDPKVDHLEGVIRLDMDDIKEVTDASDHKKEESIGPVINIINDCLRTFTVWEENHQKLEGIRELKKRLHQMDYGKLLATCSSHDGEVPSTLDTTPSAHLIQRVIKQAVLAIKTEEYTRAVYP